MKTLITSNGCVVTVAMAPAAAAEDICTTVRLIPELGSAKRSTGIVKSVDE